MLEKIKNIPKSPYVQSLHDVRNIGMLVFAVIVLLVTWSGIKVIQTNYDLQKQISVMQQQNDIKKIENSNLALKNQYLETDQYLELVARKQYNKALPGEKMLIVPRAVAMTYTVEPPKREQPDELQNIQDDGPWYERNFNAWLNFLSKD